MLFESDIKEVKKEVTIAVRELFKSAILSQTHESDIFLISIHGFFQGEIDEEMKKSSSLNLSPYVFGPGYESYETEHASDRFYYQIRQRINYGDKALFYNYKKSEPNWDIDWSINVQLEMYSYLKFWEADLVLKKLTQLTSLTLKKNYDWELSFKNKRSIIENSIMEVIKDLCPNFHKLMQSIYDRQLRNAIAHSQYYFMGDHIILTNHKNRNYYHRDEWDVMFAKFVVFYDLLNHYFNLVDLYFRKQAKGKHFGNPIRITKNGREKRTEWITLLDQRWIWYKTWERHYR